MSANRVNQTTGELIQYSGDAPTDKVGNLSAATTTNKSSVVAMVNEINSALASKVSTTSVGSANGVAELDANGRVPSSQLPSYVDDVLEYADLAHFPATGETGKIYIAVDTGKTYRWSGSGFVEISESLALGETSSTAYAGNKGKANADAIAGIKDGANIDSFADVESAISAVDGKIAFPTISSGNPADIKGLNAQVSKSSNYAIITLLTSSSSSDADKTTIEWDGNNDVVRFRNYINNTKVKEATFMSSAKKQSVVSIDSTYDAGTDWNIVKQGNICVMNMRDLKDIPNGTTKIGTIPVGFRPEWGFYEYVFSGNTAAHFGFQIGSDGDLYIFNTTGSTTGTVYVNRNVTYFTA